jgi:hypothetical protein
MAIHFLNSDGSVKSVEYAGLVLSIIKNEHYKIMSDVWGSADKAIVWDISNNSPETVYIRYCDYTWDSPSYGEVDATDDVKAAYRDYLIKKKYKKLLMNAESNASRIERGSLVEVVKGRKVPKGTTGKVVVVMSAQNGYGWNRHSDIKLGVATSDEMVDVVAKNGKTYKNYKDMVWVWAYNCKRLDVAEIDTSVLLKTATESVDLLKSA